MGRVGKIVAGIVAIVIAYFTGYAYLYKVGIALIIGGAIEALTPKPRLPGNPGVQQEYSGGVEPRRIVYGKMRISGMNALPAVTTGADNEYLHQVLVLGGHEFTAIDEYYFNQDQVSPNSITGADTDGLVASGTYADHAWIRGYLGTSTGAVDYILDNALTAWTSDHKGQGVPYLALRYKYSETVYRSGKPEVSVVVRGKKCYDARLDPSPGTNTTNPSYIAYTTNPVWCLTDYLMDPDLGLGESAARIDWVAAIAAANICDENVTVPLYSGVGSTTQKRYTCNVVLSATDRYEDNIKTLSSAMLGHCLNSGGIWRIYAGAWTSSAFTITDADIVGECEIQTEITSAEKWNSVRGWFLDSRRNYQQGEFEPVESSAFISADGGDQKWKEVQLAACTDNYECQRAAIILLRQSRNRKVARLTLGMSAYKIKLWETGTISFAELGWVNKTVRCVGWAFDQRGLISANFREETSTDWADPATGDYTQPGTTSAPTVGYTRPGTPVSFTASALPGAIKFTIGQGTPYLAGQQYRLWEAATGVAFGSASVVATFSNEIYVLPKSDTTSRDYWITAIYAGQESAQRPAGSGTAGAARLVTTDDIGANEVTFASSVTMVPFSGASGVLPAEITFTPTADGLLEATSQFTMSATGEWDDGDGAAIRLENQTDATFQNGTKHASRDLAAAASGDKFTTTLVEQFTVVSGKTYRLRLHKYEAVAVSFASSDLIYLGYVGLKR